MLPPQARKINPRRGRGAVLVWLSELSYQPQNFDVCRPGVIGAAIALRRGAVCAMGSGVRYCEKCWTEFVDSTHQCSDCGGPLLNGDLPATRPRQEDDGTVEAPVVDLAAIDSLVAEMPGEGAEHFAEAMRMEGLPSRLECGDIVRYRGPGQKASGLISLSRPVRVFVAKAHLEAAHE